MRTTVRIDDDLVGELKRRAEQEQVSFTKIFNRVLRLGLEESDATRDERVASYQEKTYDLGVPRIDLTKANALAYSTNDEKIASFMQGSQSGAAGTEPAKAD